eukprot:TRINITY_DN4917_c0_g1_i3.p1 TRINITY_DN4917_c0_g1~~TRINITY_DN4917_c0_g1_i3.p1  ORF type:complete len:155 (-),score=28.07 TRINITY_DN4917_c0_g1_i3:160-555(-)
MKLLILVCLLASLSLVESRRRYKSYRISRPRHSYGRRYKVHRHTHDYYEPTYERTYETPYEPKYEPSYEYDYEYEPKQQDNRVSTSVGTGLGGLDLAAALGLTGVGYVANSGGALHIVGKREADASDQFLN